MSDKKQPRKRAAKKAAKKVSKKAAKRKEDLEEVEAPPMSEVGAEESSEQVIGEAGPVVMDDTAFEEEEAERKEAFDIEPKWNGKVLYPFSFSRESFFYQLRKAVGAPEMYDALEDSHAFLADATRILWLCSHIPEDWRQLRSKPAELMEHIEQWAEKHIKPNQHIEAVSVALKIFNAAHVNEPEPVPDEDVSDEELGN